MHPEDIKAALRKVSSSQAAIARRLKSRSGQPITPGAVSSVIRGRTKSLRIAQEISEVTGIPMRMLFPGMYELREKPKKVTDPEPGPCSSYCI
jgi:hypothetical protein